MSLGVKEDSSPVTSPSEGFTVYLHLPHIGHNCFLFQNVDQQHHFLSALKSCIRHHNLGNNKQTKTQKHLCSITATINNYA